MDYAASVTLLVNEYAVLTARGFGGTLLSEIGFDVERQAWPFRNTHALTKEVMIPSETWSILAVVCLVLQLKKRKHQTTKGGQHVQSNDAP